METLVRDLRVAVRSLLKKPGFTAVVVLTMAAGIGATTSVFSVVNAFLLKALPYKDADRLVMIQSHDDSSPRGVSYVDYLDWRNQSQVFDSLSFFNIRWQANVDFEGENETITSTLAEWNLFSTLEVHPVLGRDFSPEDDQRDHPMVVMLSYDLWQRRFGSDQNIIGKSLRIEGDNYQIAGVMPPAFKFPSRTELWVAAGRWFNRQNRAMRIDQVIARMKPGTDLERARADMQAIAARLAADYPDTNKGFGVRLTPLRDFQIGDIRSSLVLLLGACGFVLLIACANVANLQMARANSRRREMAIRSALGASRARIIRQMITESVLLATVGGAIGALLALWAVEALTALLPIELPFWININIDVRVLGFTLAVSVVTGLLFGLATAIAASKVNLNEALKEGGRASSEGPNSRRVRSLLVVSEVALALVLLAGAGLMMKSLVRLHSASPGFNPENVLMVGLKLTYDSNRTAEQRAAIYNEVVNRVAALPTVTAAGANHDLPFVGQMIWNRTGFKIAGQSEEEARLNPAANYQAVSPDYFRTMSIPLIAGRVFTDRDRIGAPPVVIISKQMAERFWPADDAVGKTMTVDFGEDNVVWTVVGVVGNIKYRGLANESEIEIYAPCLQLPPPVIIHLVARTESDPMAIAGAVRKEIAAVSPDIGISKIAPLETLAVNTIWQHRLWGLLFGVFSLVALVMAVAGIYGVLSYIVSQRTYEIGIRQALGARPRDVLRMVIKQGLLLSLAGVATGLMVTLLITRAMSSLLVGVSATDAGVIAGVSLLLIGAALGATFVPARRATRVDPMIALRSE